MSSPGANDEMTRVGGVLLFRDDGACLLQLRDDKPNLSAAGQWVFPGGHCDAGESDGACARRELREETGYDCAELSLVTEFDYVSPDTGRKYWLSFWQARYDGVSPVYCWEGQEMRFIPRSEIAGKPTPDYLIGVWDLALAQLKEAKSPHSTPGRLRSDQSGLE
jgi:8-oxo-dGTP pyrophosphatase MutT (NUDIX family)